MARKTNQPKDPKAKKEKPLKTWGDVDRYMKSLGYTRVN